MSSLETTQNSFTNQVFGVPGKPTVEVHPMPTPRSSLPPSQNILSQKITSVPPPIPKKPEKLKKKVDQNDSSSNYHVSQNLSKVLPLFSFLGGNCCFCFTE